MKVKIPGEFKYLSHPYKVRFDDRQCASVGASGLTRFYYQEVVLNRLSAPSECDQIFWHEVLHVIGRHMNVKLEDTENDSLAEGLSYFLKEILGIELDWSLLEVNDAL